MHRIPTVCLFIATACLMGAAKADPQSDADKQKIKGQWEVLSVQTDGKSQHGQVGREKGDVIKIEVGNAGRLVLG